MKKLLASLAIALLVAGAPVRADTSLAGATLEQIQRIGFVTAVVDRCPTVEYKPEFTDAGMGRLQAYYLMDAPAKERDAFKKGSDGFLNVWDESTNKEAACFAAATLASTQLRIVSE